MNVSRFTLFLLLLSACHGQTHSIGVSTIKTDSISTPDFSNASTANEGIIYFSGDNGLSWENKSNGLPPTSSLGLGAIAVSNKSLGIATSAHGIYVFDFLKDQWRSIPTEPKIIESKPGCLTFFKDHLYLGTQLAGVYTSSDDGTNWASINTGLNNLSIRKLVQFGDRLYAGTNSGLYVYHEPQKSWELAYAKPNLQVNGITAYAGSIFIGTNQGVFSTPIGQNDWKNVLDHCAVHNISSDDQAIYAMVYNELLSSVDNGQSWHNIQKGLPSQLYTFNVIKHGHAVFAGQWDGVYRKDESSHSWKSYSNGLPENMAITNMQSFQGMIVVSGNERKLSPGMSTSK